MQQLQTVTCGHISVHSVVTLLWPTVIAITFVVPVILHLVLYAWRFEVESSGHPYLTLPLPTMVGTKWKASDGKKNGKSDGGRTFVSGKEQFYFQNDSQTAGLD